ncbi:hypothetical protein [Aeromonas sp. NJAU223]|uniref:hypothetical protein n=1 Tax=Aeromonas sp. NJAU223 TaxID=3115650 RepID=UPI003DAA1FB2
MKNALIALSVLAMAGVVQAQVPDFNASCPGNIQAAANAGVVTINGKKAALTKFSPSYYEAKSGKTTLSITTEGELAISYAIAHGPNGICQAEATNATPAVYNGSKAESKPAEAACLKAVAKKSGVAQSKLIVDYVSFSQAATGVDIKAPNDAKLWRCVSDSKGHVQGLSQG